MKAANPQAPRSVRHQFQRGLLKWLNHDEAGAILMRDAIAAVAHCQAGALWPIVLTWLETLTAGAADDDACRLCARIDAQLRCLLQASDAGMETLERELRRRLNEPPTGGTIISATLYELYLAEARGHLATLEQEPTPERTPPMIAAARALAEISATVGVAPIERLALSLARVLPHLSTAAADEAAKALLQRAIETLGMMIGAVAQRRQVEDPAPLAAELDRLGS